MSPPSNISHAAAIRARQRERLREAADAVTEALERVEIAGEASDVEDLDRARHDLLDALKDDGESYDDAIARTVHDRLRLNCWLDRHPWAEASEGNRDAMRNALAAAGLLEGE